MPRPTVIPAVKVRLDAYLDEMETAYLAQPESQRRPTLPATPDGKINVRAVAEAISLKPTQEKYLYERKELYDTINMMSEGQGLMPIGSRVTQNASDKTLKERMVQQAQVAKANGQAAVEAQAASNELLEKFREAVQDIEHLKAENLRLKAQLDIMHSGLMVRIVE